MHNKLDWQNENLKKIQKNLDWLNNLPNGALYRKNAPIQNILIDKKDNQIRLFFTDLRPSSVKPLSGIMSRIDIKKPLNLLAVYTQVMLLTLVWQKTLSSIYLLGFGAGRLPMIFHHYFPNLIIESTDIDKNVLDIAKKYFAIKEETRQKIYNEDGRAYLENQDKKYNIILIDCYTGVGHYPYPLSTKEFFETCKQRLTKDGVISINILESDPLYESKVNTLNSIFKNVYCFKNDNTNVLFASNNDLIKKQTILQRATEIQSEHNFEFPYVEHVEFINPYNNQFPNSDILSDNASEETFLKSVSPTDPMFKNISRNDICPCGSGKKYKKCHGLKK